MEIQAGVLVMVVVGVVVVVVMVVVVAGCNRVASRSVAKMS